MIEDQKFYSLLFIVWKIILMQKKRKKTTFIVNDLSWAVYYFSFIELSSHMYLALSAFHKSLRILSEWHREFPMENHTIGMYFLFTKNTLTDF